MIRLKDLLMESAADEAKQKGLKHVGFGNYADQSGKVVARSRDGKLVPVQATPAQAPEQPQPQQEPDRDDYGGEHAPPGPEDASLSDLTGNGVYPKDVYEHPEYYATGDDALDRQSFAIARQFKGNPNAVVTIYRAIPDDISVADKIAKIEKVKAYVLKHGKLPPNVETGLKTYQYYEKISDELERLKALPPEDDTHKVKINKGDWVTINRNYAKEHGEGALKGQYKIISKRVRAKEIFTNGDSIHEWGYWPGGKP